jgi:signal transduction histidine kinase
MIQVAAKDTPDEIQIQVKDQGPGIPEESLERVFDRFFRAKNTQNKASGLGLGLPIARRISEAHGGSLIAENSPLGGAIFRVRIKKL